MKKFENKQSAKLLCIVMSCYEVPDKDFKKMLGSVKSDKHVVEAFRKLLNYSGSKFKRIAPVMNSQQIQDFKERQAMFQNFDCVRN